MIKFYPVEINNIPPLATLAKEIWNEYWTQILTQSQIDYMVEKFQSENAITNQYKYENYTYYLICKNEQNIGYFGISDKESYLFLSKLYIKKEFRHQGIGAEAFKKIIEIAKLKGFKSIQLTVNKYNKNTIRAYEKYGFKTINSVVTDIGNGFVMDDYIMEYSV